MTDKIISKEIYDKSGKYIGNIVGRREFIENYNNRDLAEQIKRDNDRQKDRNNK
jgi:hypothetical protein